MRRKKIANTEKQAMADVAEVKRRMEHNHDTLIRLQDWCCHKESGWCSSHWEIYTFWDYPKHLLLDSMKKAKDDKHEISHNELTLVTYQILQALAYYESTGQCHGDIRPAFIAKGQRSHQYLVDNFQSLGSKSGTSDSSAFATLQMNHMVSKRKLYCAPEVYYNVNNKKLQSDFDTNKADCWSLGLTVMQAGLLDKDCQLIYQKNGVVDQNALDNLITDFRNRYSEENCLLCDIVEALLILPVAERHTAKDMVAQIPPFEEILSHFTNNNINFDDYICKNRDVDHPHNPMQIEHRHEDIMVERGHPGHMDMQYSYQGPIVHEHVTTSHEHSKEGMTTTTMTNYKPETTVETQIIIDPVTGQQIRRSVNRTIQKTSNTTETIMHGHPGSHVHVSQGVEQHGTPNGKIPK